MNLVGKLECNGKPWKNETVSVYESNFSEIQRQVNMRERMMVSVFPDNLLKSNWTDQNGTFQIFASGEDVGFDSESFQLVLFQLFPIRPYLYIPNYCNAEVVGIFICIQEICSFSSLIKNGQDI